MMRLASLLALTILLLGSTGCNCFSRPQPVTCNACNTCPTPGMTYGEPMMGSPGMMMPGPVITGPVQ